MEKALFVLAVPVWIFLIVSLIRLIGIFCLETHQDQWWAFPFWMATAPPIAGFGVVVMVLAGRKVFGF